MADDPVIVIGAGINGAASAIWLRRHGHEVTLIDKGEPGMGASYGNACILARCSVVPVTTPGLMKKAPGYLMNPEFPLFMRWSYFPKLLPWLMKYMSHANDADTRRISKDLATIIDDAVDQHKSLTDGMKAAKWIQPCDYTFAYRNRAAFEADRYVWALRREAGFEPELIEGPVVQEQEPILSDKIQLLAAMKEHGLILNPGDYVKALVEEFEEMGGRFIRAEARDFEMVGDKITAVVTDQGRMACKNLVVSSGIWSKPLMAKLGLNVPLEAERGYHIVFRNPNMRPNNPLMMAGAKFVATPMDQGLRCAGIVEFGGISEKKSKGPLALLRRRVAEVFPDMEAESEEEWVGFRPAPADSLPFIGEVRQSGIYTAFGHHHVGLTGGPKTGRLVADLISGQHPNCDMQPFNPNRFK